MFPKERPSHPSPERMSIVLMLKVHTHHLLLGLGPSTHVTCHCHLMLATANHPRILQTSSVHGQCMCECEYAETHTPGMHSEHTEDLTISCGEKKSLLTPEILQEWQKAPHGKGKFFQFYHPRASCITVSDIKLLFQFLIFFPSKRYAEVACVSF